MSNDLGGHLEAALSYFNENHLELLLEAKQRFFELTGPTNEGDHDYEARMNSFNDWFLFHFKEEVYPKGVFDTYLAKRPNDSSFNNVIFSLYRYQGRDFRKREVLKDILHKEKIVFDQKDFSLGLYKDDLFTGRVIEFNGEKRMLPGVCLLPGEVDSVIEKQAKKIRALKDTKEEHSFLLQLEAHKTKWKRYGHIGPKKIFSF